MVRLVGLKKLLGFDKKTCSHSYLDKSPLVDLVDKGGGFVRVDFCRECKDYRYTQMNPYGESVVFFSMIRGNSPYYIYHDLDDPAVHYEMIGSV